MKCVILQPSYIPWRGYFHQIYKADVFIFYDNVQYDRHGWRNRNRIKTATGPKWLTIPLQSTGGRIRETRICEMRMASETCWARKHFETIRHNYAKAPYFARYRAMLDRWYTDPPASLVEFTIDTTIELARELGIVTTQFLRSSSLASDGAKTDRLLAILKSVGARHYISGPAAKAYLDVDALQAAGISVEWMSYRYPEYPQLYPPFDPQLSVLDLLLNTGPEAKKYIWDAAIAQSAPAPDLGY